MVAQFWMAVAQSLSAVQETSRGGGCMLARSI
jgi:hypothetical protein